MARYHIIGIAGAGMSAIAHILLDQGHSISGSDAQRNSLVEGLETRGAMVFLGHDPSNVRAIDAVIATSAVKADHPELMAARARGFPILRRADLWREWSQQRDVIAVAGTHGKTTTTAMIALVLTKAGLQPGFLVGGEVPDLGANACWGDPGAPLVVEADEYDRTFLALAPRLAVITNVEWDHVDIYASPEDYEAAFRQFAHSVHSPNDLIACGDDQGAQRVAGHPAVQLYGIDEEIARDPVSCRRSLFDWMAANLREEQGQTWFDVWRYDRATFAVRRHGSYTIQLPGEHNVRNALAAIAAATALGVAPTIVEQALASYRGTLRRFQLKGEVSGITVIDDYAHHPTEVRATLAAARRRYPSRRLVVYLEPHTYSRTRALLDPWSKAFEDADVVRIGEIYAARERDSLGMSNVVLAGWIEHADVAPIGSGKRAVVELRGTLRAGDVVLVLGAGDSYKVGEALLAQLHEEMGVR